MKLLIINFYFDFRLVFQRIFEKKFISNFNSLLSKHFLSNQTGTKRLIWFSFLLAYYHFWLDFEFVLTIGHTAISACNAFFFSNCNFLCNQTEHNHFLRNVQFLANWATYFYVIS